MSIISPAKYRLGMIFEAIVSGSISSVFTPPAVTMACLKPSSSVGVTRKSFMVCRRIRRSSGVVSPQGFPMSRRAIFRTSGIISPGSILRRANLSASPLNSSKSRPMRASNRSGSRAGFRSIWIVTSADFLRHSPTVEARSMMTAPEMPKGVKSISPKRSATVSLSCVRITFTFFSFSPVKLSSKFSRILMGHSEGQGSAKLCPAFRAHR